MKDLDDLLKESIALRKECFHNIYSNPNNWRSGRTLSIVHKAKDGAETPLGIFREFTHVLTNARRLSPCSEENIECIEYVQGEYWLHPVPTPEPKATPEEEAAIRDYLRRTKPLIIKEGDDAETLLAELGVEVAP